MWFNCVIKLEDCSCLLLWRDLLAEQLPKEHHTEYLYSNLGQLGSCETVFLDISLEFLSLAESVCRRNFKWQQLILRTSSWTKNLE